VKETQTRLPEVLRICTGSGEPPQEMMVLGSCSGVATVVTDSMLMLSDEARMID
jgi:hypothetical protein